MGKDIGGRVLTADDTDITDGENAAEGLKEVVSCFASEVF
jgi:hypothetical protein